MFHCLYNLARRPCLCLLLTFMLTLTMCAPMHASINSSLAKEQQWTELLAKSRIIDLRAIATGALLPQYDGIHLVNDQLYVDTNFIQNTFGITRLWNENDPDEIQFTGYQGEYSIMMRIGSTSATVNGKNVGPIPAPFIHSLRQLIPLRAFCSILDIPVSYREGIVLVGKYAQRIFEFDEDHLKKLVAWLDMEENVYNESAQLLYSDDGLRLLYGQKVHSSPGQSFAIHSTGTYLGSSGQFLYFQDDVTLQLFRQNMNSGEVSFVAAWNEDIEALSQPWQRWSFRETTLGTMLFGRSSQSASMSAPVAFVVKGDTIITAANEELHIGNALYSQLLKTEGNNELLYLMNLWYGMPYGFTDNARMFDLSSGEDHAVLSEGYCYGVVMQDHPGEWGGQSSVVTGCVQLDSSKLLTTRTSTLGSEEKGGGTLCIVSLEDFSETLIAPELDVVGFAVVEDKIVYMENKTNHIGLIAVGSDKEYLQPQSVFEKTAASFFVSGDYLYIIDEDRYLYGMHLADDEAPEMLCHRLVDTFIAYGDHAMYTCTFLEPGVYVLNGKEELMIHDGYVSSTGEFADGTIVVLLGSANGGYILYSR